MTLKFWGKNPYDPFNRAMVTSTDSDWLRVPLEAKRWHREGASSLQDDKASLQSHFVSGVRYVVNYVYSEPNSRPICIKICQPVLVLSRLQALAQNLYNPIDIALSCNFYKNPVLPDKGRLCQTVIYLTICRFASCCQSLPVVAW